MSDETKQFSIRLPTALVARLDRMAKANVRTRTQEIIRGIQTLLEEFERQQKK